ncbi:MAG: hypothetical protein KatS3mg132_282 [Limisphaera sp.]|nr:MAG: hypothetical protein KatS3mg132_282 [Limisphaera sp.]
MWPGGRQRLIALDRGRSRVKLVLGERRKARFEWLEAQVVDLEEEGLVSPEEIRRHLQGVLQGWGDCPLITVLPPRLSFSQILDVPPPGTAADLPRLIEEQTARLRGLGQGPWLYEATPLPAQGRWQQPWFLTLARLEDVQQFLEETAPRITDVRQVCSAPCALAEAWCWAVPEGKDAWLLEVGAAETLLVRVRDRRPAWALTEAVGAEAWVERLAEVRKCRPAEAEGLLLGADLFAGEQKQAVLEEALRAWWARVERAGGLGGRSGPEGEAWLEAELYVSGGPVRWPGFVEALREVSGRAWRVWPQIRHGERTLALGEYALAVGAAVQACTRGPEEPSLLPPALRMYGRQMHQAALLLRLAMLFLGLVGLLLGVGMWRKVQRLAEKEALVRESESAMAALQDLTEATRRRDFAFARYWPLWDQQERTLGVLETLRACEEARSRYDFWTVLLADAESYAGGATWQPPDTNGPLARLLARLAEPPPNPTYVAELCIPATGEATLRILSELVADLRRDPLFSRVDSVPAAQRRNWVDPKVLIPDRHFVLALDMADGGWRGLFPSVRVPEVRWGTNVIRRPALWATPAGRAGPEGPGTKPTGLAP